MTAPFQLQVRGIRKAFGGVEVLHGVDLDAPGGAVLALLGENGAGKSTLVKIIAGDYQPDAGTVTIGGEELAALTPLTAREHGVRMIFQELADAPTLTVAENISLGRWPKRGPFIRWEVVRRRAREVLDQLGVALDLDAPVGSLPVGERQVVEIARALSDQARCLILDEPTAALSAQETERLFGFVRRLREQGTSLIYITHRLDEVREIADRVAVLRDGDVALEGNAAELDRAEIVAAMVGRDIGEVKRPAPPRAVAAEPVLRFRGASVRGAFDDVALDVRPGEVVALYGKLGSGTSEVAESAFGLHALSGGELEVSGRTVKLRDPADAITAGIGLLPADRQREGAFLVRSVAENLAAPSWWSMRAGGLFLSDRREAAAYARWHDALRIRSRNDPSQPLGTLSGGNQQKVLLGRWLERRSRVLLLIEPTRGVDVGARQEIYRAIRELAADGVGVLVATSDYEEVVQLADRAVVMARGRITAELDGDDITTQRLTEEVGG
ncbi:MAG TPA: sugar ABC transporter ATP-binding protein [Conexibacter sp.]|jgi:ribose transport system ATP-binding protein